MQSLWNRLENCIKSKSGIFVLNKKTTLFGLQLVKIQNTAINYILVLMKYFIFNMKHRTVYPTFDIFQKMFKMKLDIEQEKGFMNDKIDTHRLK